MHDKRRSPVAGSQPAGYYLTFKPQWRLRAALLLRRAALRQERLTRDADRGQRKLRTQMKRQPGSTWMIAPGGVDQQDFGMQRKPPDCFFKQGPLTQGEQTSLVSGPCFPAHRFNRAQHAL